MLVRPTGTSKTVPLHSRNLNIHSMKANLQMMYAEKLYISKFRKQEHIKISSMQF